jgi:dTDP-4-amino-4,6-dideoxygalactose transaminase
MIKLFDPDLSEEEILAAKKVLLSKNWASGSGTGKVKEFEESFNKYISSKATVAVNSGTAALHLALSLYEPSNKFIFVPSMSFVSTAHAVMFNNAKPIFVDIDEKTLCMDPFDLETKVRKVGDASIAVVPVHFGGMPCSMNKILDICKENSLYLIDDAAHCCGGNISQKKIGNIGDMTCFSFHPVKNLAMPTGGAITINESNYDQVRKKLNSLRWCGIDNRIGTTYDVTSISPNYYMNEVSAAVGLVQLRKLDQMNRRRSLIAKEYSEKINLDYKMPYADNCVYHLYWIIVENRNLFIEYMNDKGIEVGTHYRPIHTMSAYRQYRDQSLSITNSVGEKIVTIPIYPSLQNHEVEFIIDTINNY